MNKSFKAIVNDDTKILILGSFPSPKALKKKEYYAHHKNQFWPILQNLFDNNEKLTYEDKKALLLNNNIALWNVVNTCTADINLKDNKKISCVLFNKIDDLLLDYPKIRYIYCNGNTAYSLFNVNIMPKLNKFLNIEIFVLPSTSPANVKLSLNEKKEEWKIIKENLN